MNTPEGQEIDYENSTIVFKPIRKSLAWEDLGKINGFCADGHGAVYETGPHTGHMAGDANLYHTKEQCKASLAQAKLTQVMAKANNGWIADWSDHQQNKWCITLRLSGDFAIDHRGTWRTFLAFKTKELAVQAMEDNAQILQDYLPLAGG